MIGVHAAPAGWVVVLPDCPAGAGRPVLVYFPVPPDCAVLAGFAVLADVPVAAFGAVARSGSGL